MIEPLLPTSTLLQRQEEAEALRHALASPASVVLVEGEAGVGKTRFLTETLAGATVPVLVGHCVEQRQPAPLLAVLEALRGCGPSLEGASLSLVTGSLASLLPELAPVLPPQPPAPADPGAVQHQVFRAVIEVLAALAPVVVVLEDLHWADSATNELLQLLIARKLPGLHLVATYRREDLRRPTPLLPLAARVPAGVLQLRIELHPLDRSGVHSMLEDILATRVSDDFAAFIHDRTAGLPLAVEETLRLLTARRDLVRLHGSWARHAVETLDVPAGIQEATHERITRLSPAGQALVASVAVLADLATTSRVAALTGLPPDELDAALEECIASALLREVSGEALRFRHALAADAAYASITAVRRRRLHATAAALLQDDGGAGDAALARHLREAGDESWTRYAETAAAGPTSLLDPVGTYELLREVVTSDVTNVDRLRLAAHMAVLAPRTPYAEEAARLGVACAQTATGDEEDRAELRLVLSVLWYMLGDCDQAYAVLASCAQDAPRSSPRRVRALSMMAMPIFDNDVPASAHARSLELAREEIAVVEGADRPVVEVNLLTAELALGRVTAEQAVLALPSPEGGSEDLEGQRARWNICEFALHLGSYGTAAAMLAWMDEHALALAPEFRSEREALSLRLAHVTGQWRSLADPARLWRSGDLAAGDRHAALLMELVFTALAATSAGAHGEPGDLTSLPERARRAGALAVSLNASAELALHLHHRGQLEATQAAVEEGLKLLRIKALWPCSGDLLVVGATVLRATHGSSAAAELAAEAAHGLDGSAAPAAWVALSAATALGSTSAEQRLAGLVEAAHGFDALPRPALAAHARELAAAEARKPEAAVALLTQALSTYQQLGSGPDQARVSRALKERGAPAPARTRPVRGSGLTPRELEVAQLAAKGQSNREIAAALFLSPRTVEHHVERARQKLGAASRSALKDVLPACAET